MAPDRTRDDLPAPWGNGVAFVTGAGGFLGGAVALALQRAGWRVAGFGHAPRHPEAAQAVAGLSAWVEGHILQDSLSHAAETLGEPCLVFHAAGGASVAASLAEPQSDRVRSLGSLQALLDFLRSTAPEARLVFPSSGAVYGAAPDGPIPEGARTVPVSPYGAHKLAAEAAIGEAAAGFGLDAAIVRFFSLYGPGLRKQLLWELAGRLAADPPAVILAGSGDEVRDFLFIDDAVDLVDLVAGLPSGAEPLIVNGGSGHGTTVRELAQGLADALGARSRIGFSGEVRPGDPPSQLADTARAKALGFEPRVGLAEGLGRVAAWAAAARARAPT